MNSFNLSALAVRERAITMFFLVAIILGGIFAYQALGRAEDPPFTIKVFTVSAAWPGATAEEMQSLVADPLEKRMQELQWYDHATTIARPGLMLMTVTLKDTTPPSAVPDQFYQARKKLGDQAPLLPNGVAGPFINDEYSDVIFALYALTAERLPQRDLIPEVETIRNDFLHVPGVQKANIVGERPQFIFVNIDNQKLQSMAISPATIFAAIQQENAVSPEGSIDTAGPQIFIRLDRNFDDIEKLRDTPITADGHTLKLGDIADIERGYEDPPTYLIHSQGKDAVEIAIVMRPGWNGLHLGQALDQERATIDQTLPLGMDLRTVTNQATNIANVFDEFMGKFLESLIIVMVVCLVSLGWRVGIIVAAAIPVTLAGVLIIMLITGREFDRITLGAMIIALGLLVDDAIIAIEIIVVKLHEGLDRIKAASYAWNHTAAPMLAGTLVTIIGFTPVGFARSTAGEYAGNIFWVVGFALLVSWFVAVVFTPFLGVKFLPVSVAAHGEAGLYQTKNYQRFRRLVTWAIQRKYLVAGITGGCFLLAAGCMAVVKQQFFPTSDRPELLVDVQMPEGSSIEATERSVSEIEAWLRTQAEAETVTSYIGQGAPRFFLAYNPELPDPAYAKIIVLTPNAQARDALKWRLRDAIANGLAPAGRIRVTQLVFGPPSPYPVAFRVVGPDVDQVQTIASEVAEIMRQDPHTRQVNLDWGQKQPTVSFSIDQDRLSALGLSANDVAQQIQYLLNGVVVTQVRGDLRTINVIARSAGDERLNPEQISQFNIVNNSGHYIPISQIGTVKISCDYPYMIRRDRMPTVTVQSDIDENLQPPDVSTEVQQRLAPLIAKLPAGYQIQEAGSIEEAGQATSALLPIFPIMILLQLAVIVVQVRSLSAMMMVFLTAPLGLIGAVPVLLLFHQPFGFNAILGLIGLSGILIRNTLILIGQIATNVQNGLMIFDAVVEATVQRARPVILTALAAVLAFIPLTSSVFWGSMAYTLIGGTVVGTALILVFLPALYSIWYRVERKTVPSRAEISTLTPMYQAPLS
jgi:multidrug efflux pump subunit AcrB